jgi:hypothetical protein
VVTVGTSVLALLVASSAGWTFGAALAGVILLFVAMRLGWESWRTQRRVRTMAATPTTPCGHVGALIPAGVGARGSTADGPTTECVGRARPGPEGLLAAPFSGQPCVWYRAATIRTEDKYVQEQGYQARTTVESESVSTAPFQLVDASCEVLVDVRGIDHGELCIPGDESFHRYDPDPRRFGRGEEGRHHHEWIISPDQQLYVLGAAQLQGGWVALARPRRGGLPLLVSRRTEDELFLASRSDATTLTALAGVLGVAALGLMLYAVVQVMF